MATAKGHDGDVGGTAIARIMHREMENEAFVRIRNKHETSYID